MAQTANSGNLGMFQDKSFFWTGEPEYSRPFPSTTTGTHSNSDRQVIQSARSSFAWRLWQVGRRVMVEYGEITEAGARNDSAKGRLTRSIGMKCEPLADVRCIDLRPGDQILLCSDGLTKMLSDTELSDVLGLGAGIRSDLQASGVSGEQSGRSGQCDGCPFGWLT